MFVLTSSQINLKKFSWLCWVSVVACGTFGCGTRMNPLVAMPGLCCSMACRILSPHHGANPLRCKAHSYPLDYQGSPSTQLLIIPHMFLQWWSKSPNHSHSPDDAQRSNCNLYVCVCCSSKQKAGKALCATQQDTDHIKSQKFHLLQETTVRREAKNRMIRYPHRDLHPLSLSLRHLHSSIHVGYGVFIWWRNQTRVSRPRSKEDTKVT